MRIATIDRNDGFLRVGFFCVLLDPDAFGNDVGNGWQRGCCKCRNPNYEGQRRRHSIVSCHRLPPSGPPVHRLERVHVARLNKSIVRRQQNSGSILIIADRAGSQLYKSMQKNAFRAICRAGRLRPFDIKVQYRRAVLIARAIEVLQSIRDLRHQE